MTDRMVWLTLVEAQEAVAGDVSDVYKAVGAGRLERMIDEADGKPRFRFPQSATARRGEAGDGHRTTDDPVPLGSDPQAEPNPEPGWGAQVRVLVLDAPNAVVSVYDQDGNFIPASVVIRSSDNVNHLATVAPDREAVAEIIWRSDSGPIPEPDSWSKLTQGLRDEYLLNADALLASGALGVSADLIRAEALAEAADIARRNLREHRYPPEYGRVEEIAIALQERAAEYRKKEAATHMVNEVKPGQTWRAIPYTAEDVNHLDYTVQSIDGSQVTLVRDDGRVGREPLAFAPVTPPAEEWTDPEPYLRDDGSRTDRRWDFPGTAPANMHRPRTREQYDAEEASK